MSAKKVNLDPRALTFVNDVDNQNVSTDKVDANSIDAVENQRLKEQNRIQKLKSQAKHLYLPDDPAYVMVSDDLLAVNDLGKNLDASTRVMINVSLGDYCVFRKKPETEDGEPEPVKLNFKRVYFEDFESYQDVQEELNDINRRINLLETTGGGGTEAGLDKLQEYKKKAKEIVLKKIETGLKVFFKKPEAILNDLKRYDYNDELFNVEIGVFRYTRAPFLRQIS